MKWLLAITMAVMLAGCSASSAIASQLASDGMTRSVETQRIVIPKKQQPVFLLIKDKKVLTWMEKQIARKEQLINNKAKLVKVVKALKNRVGKTPYVFAGSSPYGWDCSGMVRWAYLELGKELPHSATKQAHSGKRVKTPKVGDIVAFAYKGYSGFYHSAIYIGNGKVVNANRGFKGTFIEPLTNYKGNRIVYVRIMETP
jgi:cell wall-associated NlpC family hydrolase